MSKVILVFCDGTGMDGNLSDNPFGALEGGGGSVQHATNVLRLSRAVKPKSNDGRPQIVFYQSGVGTEANFQGDPLTVTTAIQAFGIAVASKIRDAYAFISQNFVEGDDICIFGFSRGAYTARKVAGLIDKIGLLQAESMGFFFAIWKELTDGKPPVIPPGTRRTRIKCVGVWDTVGSVYNGLSPVIDALSIKDTSLPATIDNAFHALSMQENRKKFLPTLWTRTNSNQNLKQIWFPGAHSDVGGGYERHELADISLYWMAASFTGEVRSIIGIDTDFLRRSEQQKPDPWGTSQPHNAYEESGASGYIIGHKTRLESNDITRDAQFHSSVLVAPTNLKDPRYMITLNTLKQQFGNSWTPNCPALNEFEDYCKKNWGTRTVGDGEPIVFEKASDLFGSNFSWVTPSGTTVPPDAVVGGWVNREIYYVARASFKDGIHPAKANIAQRICYVSYGGKEYQLRSGFEVLVAPKSEIKWLSVSGNLTPDKLGPGIVPVPIGREGNTPLFSARIDISLITPIDPINIIPISGTHCGKIWWGGVANVPYGGEEKVNNNYQILVYDGSIIGWM